eukprot:SAG31_NODE_11720_length_1003_cov_17.600664_1_plen_94_part_01
MTIENLTFDTHVAHPSTPTEAFLERFSAEHLPESKGPSPTSAERSPNRIAPNIRRTTNIRSKPQMLRFALEAALGAEPDLLVCWLLCRGWYDVQ